MERLELRYGSDDGSEVRIVVDIGRMGVAVEVRAGERRARHTPRRDEIDPVLRRLGDAVVPAVAVDAAMTIAAGYELVITTAMTQSIFRWVAATPPGWEPLEEAAKDLLRLFPPPPA